MCSFVVGENQTGMFFMEDFLHFYHICCWFLLWDQDQEMKEGEKKPKKTIRVPEKVKNCIFSIKQKCPSLVSYSSVKDHLVNL